MCQNPSAVPDADLPPSLPVTIGAASNPIEVVTSFSRSAPHVVVVALSLSYSLPNSAILIIGLALAIVVIPSGKLMAIPIASTAQVAVLILLLAHAST